MTVAVDDLRSPDVAVAQPQPLRILIADDNRDAAESLALLLSLEGHAVHVSTDGLDALALAVRVHPQVAVLDIGMPGLDGHELARRLRAQSGGRSMLIVAVTGWGRTDDRQLARKAGFDTHFTKPVDPAALVNFIADWGASRQSAL